MQQCPHGWGRDLVALRRRLLVVSCGVCFSSMQVGCPVLPDNLAVDAPPMGYILTMASEAGQDIRFTEPLYTLTEAARYLAVPPNTFVTWAEGYQRHFTDRSTVKKGPVVTAFPGKRGTPRVPFVGLSEAMVLAAFRRSGLPMQRIRPAVRILQEKIGLDHALASQRVYSDGAEILYDFAERYDEDEIGMLVVVRSGQHVFRPVVANYLQRISYDDDGWARRLVLPITERKLIAVDPWRGFGQPLFLHGGAPLDNVLARIRAGESLEDVAADFEVPREDVQEALRGAA
jgi:uncharacterized protein (DUF433 family)